MAKGYVQWPSRQVLFSCIVWCAGRAARRGTVSSIRLVQTDLDNYMNKDRMLLEHYKYREIFIRRTKKAYITVLTPGILELGLECRDVGENSLRHAIKRLNLRDHLKYCRKIYAIHLRGKGIAAETIDLLQGRVPKSVFARHYLRPDRDAEFGKVRKALKSLQREI